MLKSKLGLLVNGFCITRDDVDFARFSHTKPSHEPITVPEKGVPLVADSKILRAVHLSRPVRVSGRAVKNATSQTFECNMFEKGLVVEEVGDRLRFLRFLAGASNAKNRNNANHQIKVLESLYGSSNPHTPIFIAAVDDDGIMYVSSTGVLLEENCNLDHVLIDGRSLTSRLTEYLKSKGLDSHAIDAVLHHSSVRKVPVINIAVQPSIEEVKQAVSLIGMLLTIRGFHIYSRSAENVVAEWNLIAQPLLNYIKGSSFESYSFPWAISSFKGLNLSVDDKLRANLVAPYLTCNLGVISSTTSSPRASNVRFISALKDGKWNFSNNAYSVTIGEHRAFIDPSLNDMVASALAMNKGGLDAVAKQILEAAAIYGKAAGDGTLWATSLYCEWLGITGLLGGLAINASA